MAGASAKKIAAQNEGYIKNLRLSFAIVSILSLAIRIFLRRLDVTSVKQWIGVSFPFIPSVALYRYLVRLGTPVRDGSGTLLNPGSDLNQSGITEWCFDILYLTWICQVGSAIFGKWFWLLYLAIPGFASYKLWTSALGPLLFSRGAKEDASKTEQAGPTSKRQQKLQARADRGDPRVRSRGVQ